MLEYKGNKADPEASDAVKGLWEVYEDEGTSTFKEHQLKTIWQSCKPEDHFFEITNSPKREATCKHCKMKVNFILGIDTLVNGQFHKK